MTHENRVVARLRELAVERIAQRDGTQVAAAVKPERLVHREGEIGFNRRLQTIIHLSHPSTLGFTRSHFRPAWRGPPDFFKGPGAPGKKGNPPPPKISTRG